MRSSRPLQWFGAPVAIALLLNAFASDDDAAVDSTTPAAFSPSRAAPAPRTSRALEAYAASHRYEELPPDVRAEYDRRQRDRLARLGASADLRVRLEPPVEVVSLDGQPFAEVTP